VLDVSDPTLPVEIGALDTPGWANDVELVGDLAYVAGWSGLHVINVSDPASPVELGNLWAMDAYDVEVVGDLAYVVDGWSELHLIDVSDPALPVGLGTLAKPGTAEDVEVGRLRPRVPGGARGLRHAVLRERRRGGGRVGLRG
jgi:hypothetical protein